MKERIKDDITTKEIIKVIETMIVFFERLISLDDLSFPKILIVDIFNALPNMKLNIYTFRAKIPIPPSKIKIAMTACPNIDQVSEVINVVKPVSLKALAAVNKASI